MADDDTTADHPRSAADGGARNEVPPVPSSAPDTTTIDTDDPDDTAATPTGGDAGDGVTSLRTTADRSGRGLVVVAVVLLVALIAAAGVAFTQMQRVDDLESELDARSDVAAAAARFGEAYLSYDFDDPEGSGEQVVALATPDFGEEFSSDRVPGIAELFANLQTTTEAETQEVFVADVSGDTARAFVVTDIEAISTASGSQKLTNLAFVLDLVRLDGEWLVDAVNPAPQPDLAGDEATAPTDPNASTTTTAPVAPTTAAP